MKNNAGYAVHITPGKYLAIHETDLSLEEIHTLLECDHIEVVHMAAFPFPNIVMLIDESGKCKSHSVNPIASVLYGAEGDYIAGDALLVKIETRAGESDIAPLTLREAETVTGVVSMLLGAYVAEGIKTSVKSAEGGH